MPEKTGRSVQDDLIEFVTQAGNGWQRGVEVCNSLGNVFPLVARNRERGLDRGPEVDRLLFALAGMGEGLHRTDDASNA